MMRRLSLVLAACLGFAVPPASAAPASKPLVEGAIDGFVRPAYGAFHASTVILLQSVRGLCATPSQQALDAVRENFSVTVSAWSRVEIIRFGPATEENRLDRILFWPDRKGTGLKQVQAALAQEDESAADPVKLAGKSVAMQGLGALEFVLFGANGGSLATSAPYRCAYGAAIAGNLASMAGAIAAGWNAEDGIATMWANPGPGNALYRDDSEALGELFDVFVNGLELVRDVRINGFLGKEAAEDKPKQALFWRSGLTVPALLGNMAGMQALFSAARFETAMKPDTAWVAQSIGIQLGNAVATAAAVEGPPETFLQNPALRYKLDHLRLITSSLSNLFGKRLAAEFGVTAGFSSLDGD